MKKISRRNFIKYSAALAATGALSGVGPRRIYAKGTGGKLTVGFSGDPGHLDPTIEGGGVGWSTYVHMFDAAVFKDKDSNPIPWLVERWEQVSPTVIRFHCRKGVKFHSGDDFTGEAIATTWKKVASPGSRSPYKTRLQPIIEYKLRDPHTLDLILAKPIRPLLSITTNIFIISPEALKKYGDRFSTNPVGTGPFKFVEYRPGSQVVMERYPDYWGKKAILDELRIRFIPENGTRVASLEAGDVMMINNVPPDKVPRLKKNPEIDVLAARTNRVMYVSIRTDRPPFNDKRVRQAMNYAIDKEALTQGLMGGMGIPVKSPLPQTVWSAPDNLPPYKYDPKRARKLLEEAGAIGAEFNLGIANGRYVMDKQVGEAIAGYLQEAGLNVKAEAPPWGTLVSELTRWEKNKYDGMLLGWGVMYGEPHQLLHEHFNSKSGYRRTTMYKNPEVDWRTQEASEIFDLKRVDKLYREAQEYIWDDCPWIWLYRAPDICAKSKKLNWSSGRLDELWMFTDASLKS